MPESFPHVTGDQQLQPAVPVERVPMTPGVEYGIDIAGDSLYDPATVGLAPTEEGTSFKVMGALELGVPESSAEQADEGASVFVVEVINPNGATEVGLMGAQRNEQGNLTATESWQSLPRSFPSGSSEVVLGRRAKGDNSAPTEGFAGKIDVASLFPGQPDKDLTTVSRKHLALRLEGLGDSRKLVVRDLDSANGTQLIKAKAEDGNPSHESGHRSAAPASRLIGSLATPSRQEVITEVPEGIRPSQTEAARPTEPSPEDRQLIESKLEGIDTMIAADPRLTEVQRAVQRVADLAEDKRQNWLEARKPGSDQEVYGRQSRRLQEWEADAQKQLAQLPASDRDRYDSLMAEQRRLRAELNPSK